jgi:hypothetical protein
MLKLYTCGIREMGRQVGIVSSSGVFSIEKMGDLLYGWNFSR